jgi:hypothetical protein
MHKRLAFLLGLLMAGCSAGSSFGPPDSLDSGTFERVNRTVEDQLMDQGAAVLGRLGLQEPFGAAYEFIHYKPQFFLGAGKGSANPQALIDAVLPLFGGKPGLTEPAHEVTRDGETFLCGPYRHTGVPGTVGTGGLASIAAICAWSDGGTAGFGVGVAGPSVEDVVGLTSEARAGVAG